MVMKEERNGEDVGHMYQKELPRRHDLSICMGVSHTTMFYVSSYSLLALTCPCASASSPSALYKQSIKDLVKSARLRFFPMNTNLFTRGSFGFHGSDAGPKLICSWTP
mmetsp:Transcript_37242/g.37722  ORF Transcript_37242/g.37722 Transcript_37242/m.37722 type:complete len:108 (+) Transcript_37242:276-599(+)